MILSNKFKKYIFSNKNTLKPFIPKFLIYLSYYLKIQKWIHKYSFSPFRTPTFVKQKILLKHSIKDSKWIETGTYIGSTTGFLAKNFPIVHTIEPSKDCLEIAKSNLKNFDNIIFHFGTSEETFEKVIKNSSGNICFWLDGHYSDGITFSGDKQTPIIYELETISNNIRKFENVIIFVDDISSGFIDRKNYPQLDFYVEWARRNKLIWTIEQGIFIMKSSNLNMY